MATIQFNKDEVILYKDMKGVFTAYKVLAVNSIDEYYIGVLNADGKVSKNKFTTTLTNKEGDTRLFRLWVQPGDKCIIDDKDKSRATIDTIGNYDNEVTISAITKDSVGYNFNLKEAEKISS